MITHDWGQALVPNCVQPPQSVFAGHVFIMSFCLYVEKLCVGGGSGKQSQGVTVLFTPFYRLVRIPKSRNPEIPKSGFLNPRYGCGLPAKKTCSHLMVRARSVMIFSLRVSLCRCRQSREHSSCWQACARTPRVSLR